METFGFFEAIAHENTRKSTQSGIRAEKPQMPSSQDTHRVSEAAAQAAPATNQAEPPTDDDPVLVCWGMF